MLTGLFWRFASAALIASAGVIAVTADAQTIIQNERLVNTTLVVIRDTKIAECARTNCRAITAMLDAIPVTCPGGAGQTCTLHIVLDAKVSTQPYCFNGCGGLAGTGFYRFLVDGAPPDLGPTGKNGGYLLEDNVWGAGNPYPPVRQSLPASVFATVTNGASDQHTIAVAIGCEDTVPNGGCQIASHQGTMRIDAFQP